jgi:3,4-dihydroxyphenylacetate 2,3-dioxygenase
MAGVTQAYLSVHTPRYCTYEAALAGKLAHPDFRPVRDGLVAQGEHLQAARPDVIVINSCHLIATFPTVVVGTPRHRGILTAQEAPELIHGVEYDFPGDYVLAAALVERGKAEGVMCTLADDVHYPLDYGTVMPLVCYLDRTQTIPVVPVSVCLAADLHESFGWGRRIAQVAREHGRRVAFVASGSVSHKLVRGPEKWPSADDQALDRRFAETLASGEYEKLWSWLPEYADAAEPEMKGRHLAMLLGALVETGRRFIATVHAYGPSSGSGNYVVSLADPTDRPAAARAS